MYRAALLLTFIITSSAKILNSADHHYILELDYGIGAHDFRVPDDPIWVLKVHIDRELELRPATLDEEEEFEENNGPQIENYEKRLSQRGVSPKTRAKVDDSKIVEKEDIFRLLNKFLLYNNVEPDIYLTESNEDSTYIAIYFRSPYASLVINVGSKQWHYFIGSQTPSPLPLWFYESHVLKAGESTVRVPEEVKQRFYIALLRMLLAMLTYPL